MSHNILSRALVVAFVALTAGCGAPPLSSSDAGDAAVRIAATPAVQPSAVFGDAGSAAYYLRTAYEAAEAWASDAKLVEIVGQKTNRDGHIEGKADWSYTFVSQRYPQHAYVVQVNRSGGTQNYQRALGALLIPIGEWTIDSPEAMKILQDKVGRLGQPDYEMRLRGHLDGQPQWHVSFSHRKMAISFLAMINANTGETRIIY